MRPTRHASLLALACAPVLSVACGSEPLPIEHQTEHLRIGAALPLCQGDLDGYERTIAVIEDELGIEMDRTVELYIWDFLSWEARDHECKAGAQGCYNHQNSVIYTSTFSVHHELAHAVVGNPALHDFFSEGVAQAYGGFAAPFGLSSPLASAQLDDVYDARTAAHFVRWLRERWGGHKLGEFARSEGSLTDFEAIYGISLAEAEAVYFAEAPGIYPPMHDCTSSEITTANPALGWQATVELDCSEGQTRTGASGLFVDRTLLVPEDGRYSFVTDGAWLGVHRCEDGPTQLYFDSDALEQEDVPSAYAAFPSSATRFFAGQTVHTVDMRRGRYELNLGVEGYEAAAATVKLWPALGSGPAE